MTRHNAVSVAVELAAEADKPLHCETSMLCRTAHVGAPQPLLAQLVQTEACTQSAAQAVALHEAAAAWQEHKLHVTASSSLYACAGNQHGAAVLRSGMM